MTVKYNIQAKTLREVMATVLEIHAVAGIEPQGIVMDDGREVSFDLWDAKRLRDGEMSERAYASRHVRFRQDGSL